MTDDLIQSLQQAAATAREAGEALRKLVVSATGLTSENRIATATGLSRDTVRSWVGKPKRGDRVTAIAYYGDDEKVTGFYQPRTDHDDALPPADAAWVDNGGVDGATMVKANSVTVVKR